jgi:hypothetical protein
VNNASSNKSSSSANGTQALAALAATANSGSDAIDCLLHLPTFNILVSAGAKGDIQFWDCVDGACLFGIKVSDRSLQQCGTLQLDAAVHIECDAQHCAEFVYLSSIMVHLTCQE